MRLSDAISLGRVTVNEFKRGRLSNCALGMAANSCGIPTEDDSYYGIFTKWGWLMEAIAPCPICETKMEGSAVVWHLFDSHVIFDESMTLDHLIDFVRSIEPAEEGEQISTVSETQTQKRETIVI